MTNNYEDLVGRINSNSGYRDHVAIVCLRRVIIHLVSDVLTTAPDDQEYHDRNRAIEIVTEKLEEICNQFQFQVKMN
jgi:hypothetical protein